MKKNIDDLPENYLSDVFIRVKYALISLADVKQSNIFADNRSPFTFEKLSKSSIVHCNVRKK